MGNTANSIQSHSTQLHSTQPRSTQPHNTQAQWQREFRLTREWQDRLNTIWQLQQGFALKVLQSMDPLSSHQERSFALAHETQCYNGSRSLVSYTQLTPAFNSVCQLEDYVSQHSVEILHSHFYGEQETLAATAS